MTYSLDKLIYIDTCHNKAITGRRRIGEKDPKIKQKILAVFDKNPFHSQRTAAKELGISKSSLQKLLKGLRLHPYKLVPVHILGERHKTGRLQFCRWMIENLRSNRNFFRQIITSDECIFATSGIFNRQNCRRYAIKGKGQRIAVPVREQGSPSVMTWCGIVNDQIIGPYFFDENVTGQSYLNLLKNQMMPEIKNTVPQHRTGSYKRWFVRKNLIFQQDGAGPHFSLKVRKWLNENWDGKWIGRHHERDKARYFWPSKSPDLAPPDFFLWGFLKGYVYDPRKPKITNIDELKHRITVGCQKITKAMLRNVRRHWKMRLEMCIKAKGDVFENLI